MFTEEFEVCRVPGTRTRALALALLSIIHPVSAATTDGPLRMEVIAAPNFVVDSNIESPAGKSPSAAHLGVKIFNSGPTALTNVRVNIGHLTDAATGSGSPGTFPSRTVTVSGSSGYSGTFALEMPGGASDAVRVIPRIEPGEVAVQYFFVTYPLLDGAGKSVTGSKPDPSDDLWLNYDIWASAADGADTRRVDRTTKVTMRSEISAMANKIWPNTTSKVPAKYLDAIEQSLGWRPNTATPQTGSTARMEGIWYDLGNVGAGFDNDGDGLPDRNLWMQPVGDPSRYSPLAARLVKAYGIVIVKLRDGTEKLIPFEDQLYFTKIPENNTGAVGLVFYEFVPLASGGSAQLSPYQEVASGYNNEKFNGDYGNSVGSFTATPPAVSFDKAGPSTISGGGTASYSLTATNTGSTGIGEPSLALPFVFEDAIPAGLVYVTNSATTTNTVPGGNSVAVTWSTDNGANWTPAEPAAASVTRVRWTLASPLAAGTTAVARFQASVPTTYPTVSIANTGIIKLGSTGSLATSTVTTLLSGINSIGSLVWKDDNRNSIKEIAESGIAGVTVNLYHDANGNGALDASDPLFRTTQTDANGVYAFINLPDGKFIAVVDVADTDLPAGFGLPVSVSAARPVDLDSAGTLATAVNVSNINWPFISALTVVKSTTPTSYNSGDLITYNIDLENNAAPVAAKTNPVQTAWSGVVTSNNNSGNNNMFPANAAGAPDQNFANMLFSRNADKFTFGSLSTFGSPGGTITGVEFVFSGYISQTFTDDVVEIVVNGTAYTLTTAQLNAMTGSSAIRSVALSAPVGGWNWTNVQALSGTMEAKKSSSADPGTIWVDSLGFRVTTTATPAATGSFGPSTINFLPLVDTFDATRLAYVSASVAPTSVVGGTITWANLGPLNAGARRTIQVVFRALNPAVTSTTLNTVTSTGSRFVSGLAVNSATGTSTVTVERRGSIGDLVWADLNGNGIQDAGEPGLANVRVTLDNGAQTQTDSNGYYLFPGLADGTYIVTVDTTTLPWSIFTQTKDPDATVNNASTVTINNSDGITTNDNYLDRDFGYRSTTLSVISGFIFQDNNGNGLRDMSEAFLFGLTVTLLRDADLNGTFETNFATTTTDSTGFYRFGSLPAGSFRVVVSQPASTVQTLDPDLAAGVLGGDNAFNRMTVAGGFYPNNNFAYQPSGSLALGGTLYLDWNGNGVRNTGDSGVASVDVFLYRDVNGDGIIDPVTDPLRATAETNSSGGYIFTGLPAGNYIVVVNTADPQFPAGVQQTQDYDGIRDNRAFVNLTATLNNVDFGYHPQGTGSIGDVVFVDTNGDGIKGASEPGIANVVATLYRDVNNNGMIDIGTDSVVATATTSATGSYLFTSLAAGRYLVSVDPNGASIPSDGGGNKFRATTPVPHDVTLAAAQIYLNADFGFAAGATIGDFVFFDSNGNGTQDYNEPGIPNVTLQLFLQSNLSNVIASAVTADGSGSSPAGFYEFTNLPAGTYTVKVLTSTLPQADGQPIPQTSDPDRDGIPVSDTTTYPGLPPGDNADSDIIVTLGSRYSGADFGYQPPGAIGDFIWLDLDGNGIQGPGEPGIAGVTVRITNGTLTYNVVTDFDGYWSYANLPDGPWTVSVPAGNFLSGAALFNTIPAYDAQGVIDSSVALVLSSGVVNLPVGNLGIDFGYKYDGSYSLAGTVLTNDTRVLGIADDIDDFYDDGIDQDAGPLDETELEGITVYLYTTSGTFLGSKVTDPNGRYNFSGLPSGQYRVIIGTDANALLNSTLTTTAANNPAVTSVDSSSGTSVIQTLAILDSNVSAVDFAFIPNFSYDYGDLPLSYGMTTLGQDGARHGIPTGGSTVYLGTAPDAETNGIPSSLANGDDLMGTDDEDGVTPASPVSWTDGPGGGSIQVSVTGSGWLVGWIDWNNDGNFLDPGEMIASQSVGTGITTISLDIPAGTIGADSQSWLSRFRVFTTKPPYPLFSYTGTVMDGEVEDHLIEKPVGGSIGDLVWDDLNGNGVFDSGEEGIGGMVVVLRDEEGIEQTQTTGTGLTDVDGDGVIDPVGYYRFRGLGAGEYTVTITTPPVGFTASFDEDGIGSAHVVAVQLATGVQHLSADFGYKPMLANISGSVLYDNDASGSFSGGDGGAPGVKVQLWKGSVQVGETYTNGSGDYIFTEVPTGNYVIIKVNPSGSNSVTDVDGVNDDRTDVAPVGENIIGRDFLNTAPPLFAIGGTVYHEGTENDQVIGAEDTPLASVLVKLFFDRDGDGVVSAGDTELTSVFTGTDGAYIFADLPAGMYVIQKTNPAGGISEWDADGSLLDGQIGVTLSGADITGRDFLVNGYLRTINEWKDKWDTDLEGNPDGDRYDNLVEYAFDLSPNSGIGKPFCLVAGLGGTVDGVFRRAAGGGPLDVTYFLEFSAALGNPTLWSALQLTDANTTVSDAGDGSETIRISDLESFTGLTGGAGFVRLRVVLDDGTVPQPESHTEVLGWVETELEVACRTYNNPFLRCSSFTGTVGSVDGQDLVVTDSAGPSGLDGLLEADVSYYVEITNGPNEGHRLDVASAAGDRITLANASSFNTLASPAGLAGASIILRRHWTLDELFPPSGFDAAASPSDANQVQVFTGGIWKIYWLANGAPSRWLDAADDAEAGNFVLPPGQGMLFNNRLGARSVLAFGEVRDNAFVRPLATGSNLVGGGYPVDQSAAGRAMSIADGFFGSRDFKTADSIFVWNGDQTIGAAGYTTYYLLDASASLRRWVKTGDASLLSRDMDPILLRNRSVFIRTAGDHPGYRSPAPWSP